ncbi:hypothetical protein QQF64_004650 [Cirrhinus molitorella]|uniref:Uncharacterized protein n=1 Tax=Cirrhinus molitorella TaxID=172907 RepID=A0ABR3MI78_9TELE
MKTLSSPSEHLNAQVRIGESVPLVKPGLVCATPSTEEFSFPTIHSTTFHLTASTKVASVLGRPWLDQHAPIIT